MKTLRIDDSCIAFSTPAFSLGQFVRVHGEDGSDVGWIIGIKRALFTYDYLVAISDSDGQLINDSEETWVDQINIEAIALEEVEGLAKAE